MSQPAYFYPQKMGRVILMALDETLGPAESDAALSLSNIKFPERYPPANDELTFPFESVSGIHAALEETYGANAGRGIALRVGRSTFKYGLREYGLQMGLMDATFRLLPLPAKLRAGAKAFSNLLNEHTDQRVHVEETDEKILWRIDRCPLCWMRKADAPICHLAVGLLQEALYWISGGKTFQVDETLCIARGDASCRIEIPKAPIA